MKYGKLNLIHNLFILYKIEIIKYKKNIILHLSVFSSTIIYIDLILLYYKQLCIQFLYLL